MKSCVIYGDLSSDRAGDQYPTAAVCDKCVASESLKGTGEDERESQIVQIGSYDPDYGDECAFCGTTYEEEQAR